MLLFSNNNQYLNQQFYTYIRPQAGQRFISYTLLKKNQRLKRTIKRTP